MLLGLALFDAALLTGSYNVLFWHRFDRWAGLTGSVSSMIMVWIGSSYLMGRYSRPDKGKREAQLRRLITTLTVGTISLVIVVVIASWGLRIQDPRTFRNFVVPVLTFTTLGSYAAQSLVIARQRRAQKWLALGNNFEIDILGSELRNQAPIENISVMMLRSEESRFNEDILSDNVDGLAISEIAQLNDRNIERLLAARSGGVRVINLVRWCEQYLQRVPPEVFTSRWLVQAEGFDLQPGYLVWRVKRLGDIALAASLALMTLPVVAIAILAIKLEDGGPVLYKQIRTGLYGSPFEIWKLRSMRVDAEKSGAQWATREDRRITRVGALLRKLRIDELPQLLCVLKGDMSMIGPRPERPELELILEQEIEHYRVRHWVRPGLSGWAQVCYPYGASISDSRMKLSYDLYYIKNSSILLDLLILIKTIRLIARGQGASPAKNSAA